MANAMGSVWAILWWPELGLVQNPQDRDNLTTTGDADGVDDGVGDIGQDAFKSSLDQTGSADGEICQSRTSLVDPQSDRLRRRWVALGDELQMRDKIGQGLFKPANRPRHLPDRDLGAIALATRAIASSWPTNRVGSSMTASPARMEATASAE